MIAPHIDDHSQCCTLHHWRIEYTEIDTEIGGKKVLCISPLHFLQFQLPQSRHLLCVYVEVASRAVVSGAAVSRAAAVLAEGLYWYKPWS